MVATPSFEPEPTPVAPVHAVPFEAHTTDPEVALETVLSTIYTDSDDLVGAMVRIGEELPGRGLAHVLPFNTAYLTLSSNVRDRVKESIAVREAGTGFLKGYHFENPEVVEETMGIFAELYFKQVLAHITPGVGESGVDEAWRPLFYSAAGRNASPGIQFLLGMNAHIVYDLPQALHRSSGVTQSYYEDYRDVVGGLIDEVASDLAPAYVPGGNRTRGRLTHETVLRIADWREDAWKAGMNLRRIVNARTGEYFTRTESEGRFAIHAILRGCERAALKNAKFMRYLGRIALSGVALVGGKPPKTIAEVMKPAPQLA